MYHSIADEWMQVPQDDSASSRGQPREVQNRTPRVSIVMSVHNDGCRVARAVDSLLRQTWTDFELIIIDDGSTDDTPTVLDDARKRDGRVRIITQENTGLTRALIRGCAEATGDYIARQDADDWSHPDRIAAQVAMLDSNLSLGLVSCTTRYVGPNDEHLDLVSRCESHSEATWQLLNDRIGPPAHGSVMFRRRLYQDVGGYRPEFYFGQDADLWLRMAERSQIGYCRRELYTYRRDLRSISSRMGPAQQQFGEIGQACRAARSRGHSEQDLLRTAQQLSTSVRSKSGEHSLRGASVMAYLIGTALVSRDRAAARSYFWKSIRSNPLNWRAWLRMLAPGFRRKPGPKTAEHARSDDN
jgi:glycosyltransferase involved in cell wall biosynthesis